jgi:polar amino acid transport system permease protein
VKKNLLIFFYQLSFYLLLGLMLFLSFSNIRYSWNWPILWNYKEKFLSGWILTLKISALSLILSLFLGWLLLMGQRSLIILKVFCQSWINLIRGTPLLVQILIFFYVIANAAGFSDRFWLAIFILSNFSAAYIAEILRAAIEGIPQSQWDAAKALGLNKKQTYTHVILPQLFKASLPALAGQFASIVKDSSLLSVIAVSEFTLSAQEVNSLTYSTLEAYIPLALGYLLITAPISWISHKIEMKLHYEA